MINIYKENSKRFEASYEKIRSAYLHKNIKELPLVIVDVNYALAGQTASLIPDDYFTNYDAMFTYQVEKIKAHLRETEDDYIPLLFPWYGIGVVPSALGCDIVFQDKLDPAVASSVISNPNDIKKLSMPDPYKDGLMPKVLECIDYMVKNSDIPVSFTDCQGPLSIALCLCGVENLFIWMYEYPSLVHELMDFCADVLIEWVKVQKKHAGQQLNTGAFPHSIVLPKDFGGVWISDDDCTIMSPQLYKEFVVPYNSKVFKAFGGGTLHFCGNAEHQLENFLNIEGITGINNFCMGNFQQIVKMQDMYEDRLAVMICDFNPLNIDEYYTELFKHISYKGAILGIFIAPEFALYNGKYEFISRDGHRIINDVKSVVNRLMKEKRG